MMSDDSTKARREKEAEASRAYYWKNRAAVLAKHAQDRKENPGRVRETKAKWEAANRERHLASRRAYWAKNREKMAASAKSRRMANPRRAREHDARGNYGITAEELSELEAMYPKCAVCGSDNGTRALCVDHDHATGAVRGLLCAGCNAAIGMMKDSPLRLRKAAEYLDARQPKLHGVPALVPPLVRVRPKSRRARQQA